jgi:hypothetical protein
VPLRQAHRGAGQMHPRIFCLPLGPCYLSHQLGTYVRQRPRLHHHYSSVHIFIVYTYIPYCNSVKLKRKTKHHILEYVDRYVKILIKPKKSISTFQKKFHLNTPSCMNI